MFYQFQFCFGSFWLVLLRPLAQLEIQVGRAAQLEIQVGRVAQLEIQVGRLGPKA
jgi:hypothetical protein